MAVERLEAQGVFQYLRPEQVKAISNVATVVEYEAGKMIFKKDAIADHFFVVLEGQVSLRLPARSGVSLQIDELTKGAMFGSCVCFQLANYSLNAVATSKARLLKVESATLKELMDRDLVLGYTVQTQISRIYFNRYIDTMKKLQSIVLNLPLESSKEHQVEVPVAV